MDPRQAQPADLIREVANGNLSLSIKRCLLGAIDELGGPEEFGREIARTIHSDEVPVTAQVSLITNLLKAMGQYGDDDAGNDSLVTEELITAQLQSLDHPSH